MAIYTYRAIDGRGCRICGHREMPSLNDVKQYLERKGLEDYTIFVSQTEFSSKPYKHISPGELSFFCYMVASLPHTLDIEPSDGDGKKPEQTESLITGFNMLSSQTENKQLKLALKEICDIMRQGFTLAEAMGMYGHLFTNYMLNMISIGETTGSLRTVFLNLSTYFEKEASIRDRLKAALLYPSILAGVTFIVIIAVIVFILPGFDELLKSIGDVTPVVSSNALSAAITVGAYLLLFFILVGIAAAAMMVYVRRKSGKAIFDKLKFKIPVFRYFFIRASAIRVARSLAMLVGSGVQVVSAVKIVNALDEIRPVINNRYVDDRLSTAIKEYRSNGNIEQVFDCLRIFPPLFLKMFSMGIAVGNPAETLDKLADILEKELNVGFDRLIAELEPVLTIILSVVLGAVLIAVMLPLINVMGAI